MPFFIAKTTSGARAAASLSAGQNATAKIIPRPAATVHRRHRRRHAPATQRRGWGPRSIAGGLPAKNLSQNYAFTRLYATSRKFWDRFKVETLFQLTSPVLDA